MPTMRRDHEPVRPSTKPAPRLPLPQRELSLPARLRRLLTPPGKNRAWPAMVTLVAFIMFIVAWTQTTFVVALVVALAGLVAGAMLLTLMFGTAWIVEPRRRTVRLRQDR
jgi:hypothetical protein